jgi:hypothetical protein
MAKAQRPSLCHLPLTVVYSMRLPWSHKPWLPDARHGVLVVPSSRWWARLNRGLLTLRNKGGADEYAER